MAGERFFLTTLEDVIENVQRFRLPHLKMIVHREQLPISGSKAKLQERIIKKVHHYYTYQHYEAYNGLAQFISNPDNLIMGGLSQLAQSIVHRPSRNTTRIAASATSITPASLPYQTKDSYPLFRESPFFTVLEPLTPVPEAQGSRSHFDLKIPISPEVANKLKDPSIKVMVYCTSELVGAAATFPLPKADITFPRQIEIKINGVEVNADLKGIDKKIGSTKPADITSLIVQQPDHPGNFMNVSYPPHPKVSDQRKFYYVINLVKQYSSGSLVHKINLRRPISVDEVIQKMIQKGADADIETTSSVMTLKCPLSISRIKIPCRSTSCTHNACFDSLTFLQLQEQAPLWQCPICNKEIEYGDLAIDQYVSSILSGTKQSIEKVTILPNGTWGQITTPHSEPSMFSEANPFELPSISTTSATPPSTSSNSPHEPSSSSYNLAGTKRPVSVIEISSDDESGSDSDERPLIRRRATTSSSSQRGIGGLRSWSDIESELAGGGALWQNND